MQGLRIGKPPVYNENANMNMNVIRAYVERATAAAGKAEKPVVEEEEEVWEVPNAIFNIKNVAVGNNANLPLEVQRNISWANKPPSTPREQMIKPKNQPPRVKGKRNRTRKTRKGRKSTKQNRR